MNKEQYSEVATWLEWLDENDRRFLICALRTSIKLVSYLLPLKDSGLSGGECADAAIALAKRLTVQAKRVHAEEITEANARTPAHCRVSYWIGDEP